MLTLDMIMSTDLITIGSDDNLAKARELMHDNKIHHLPVVDGDDLVGLVSLTDVLAATDSILRQDDRIGCLPVMSDSTLKGIITDTDFVAVAINLLEQLEEEDFDEFEEEFEEAG